MGLRPATCFTAAAVVAGVLGIGPGGPKASACGFNCGGYGYARAYHAPYGPPGYGHAVPVAVYVPPPPPYVHAYAPAYPAYAPVNYYITRVTVLRGPRRAYRAVRWRRAYVRGWRRW